MIRALLDADDERRKKRQRIPWLLLAPGTSPALSENLQNASTPKDSLASLARELEEAGQRLDEARQKWALARTDDPSQMI